MSFQDYLDNLREKPDHIRKRYSFFISFGITAIIFAFWISSFGTVTRKVEQASLETVNRAGTPAQSLVASVGSFFVDLKDLIFGPKKVEYTTVKVLPGRN